MHSGTHREVGKNPFDRRTVAHSTAGRKRRVTVVPFPMIEVRKNNRAFPTRSATGTPTALACGNCRSSRRWRVPSRGLPASVASFVSNDSGGNGPIRPTLQNCSWRVFTRFPASVGKGLTVPPPRSRWQQQDIPFSSPHRRASLARSNALRPGLGLSGLIPRNNPLFTLSFPHFTPTLTPRQFKTRSRNIASSTSIQL